MKLKNLILACLTVVLSVFILFSFKDSVNDPKKITIFRQYLSADADYGNFIIINYPDGKNKKQMLMQNKHANYELNDKIFTQMVNEMIDSGLKIKHVTSSGDSHLTITTFILE